MREDPFFFSTSPYLFPPAAPSYYSERYYDYPRLRHHDPFLETRRDVTFPLETRSHHSYRNEGTVQNVDDSMRKMTDDMNRMMNSMQRLAPHGSTSAPSVDELRISENFQMENPIKHELDGSRKFRLQFDVRQFRPEEISVKTSGNQLTVHARHEDKDSGKSVFREYHRQYVLPKEVNPEFLQSKLTDSGALYIEAPLPSIQGPRDKLIPIDRK